MVSPKNPSADAADVLVVNLFEGEKPTETALAALDQKLHGILTRLWELEETRGKLYETTLLPTNGAIAQLGGRQNVLGIVPAVENMPSGHAMRPGDVLTALNGKTIEVLNWTLANFREAG